MYRLSITRRIFACAGLLCLVGCAGLPTEQQVARRYASEHRDRRVIGVTSSTTGVPWQMRAQFRVSYTEDGGPQKTDVVRYHQVAEGWVRDL